MIDHLRLFTSANCEDAAFDQASREAIACIRLLTRIVPVALEDENTSLSDQIFWDNGSNDASSSLGVSTNRVAPLAITLLDTIMAMLFLPGFTINEFAAPPPTLAQLRQKRNAVLPLANVWAEGVAATDVFPSTAAHNINRVEVLRLLLVCLSSTMYERPSLDRPPDSWLHYLVCRDRSVLYFSAFDESALSVSVSARALHTTPLDCATRC